MDGHLIAIEVRVERRANERMQLDRLALDEHGLEGLDAEPVQSRRTVQKNGVLPDDLFENVPDLGTLALDEALGSLDRRRLAPELELGEDERFEKLQSHLFRQAALVELQRRSDHYNRAA